MVPGSSTEDFMLSTQLLSEIQSIIHAFAYWSWQNMASIPGKERHTV